MVEEPEVLEAELAVVAVPREAEALIKAVVPEGLREVAVPEGLREVAQPELVVQVQAGLREVLVEGLVVPEEEGVELVVAFLPAEGALRVCPHLRGLSAGGR